MFQHLYDFGYKRQGIEVFGFFISYLLATIILGAIIGSIVASLFGGDAARVNWKIDSITASIVVLLLTFYIIKRKHLGPNIIYTLLPLGAAIVSQFLTPAIALMIPSFLSSFSVNIPYTPPPKSGDIGANETIIKEQQKEPRPPAQS